MRKLVTTRRRLKGCDQGDGLWSTLRCIIGTAGDDDEMIPLLTILNTTDLSIALRCLDVVVGCRNAIRLYGYRCARRVLPIYESDYPGDLRPRHAVETAGKHARGQATDVELRAAWDAACTVVGATWSAANAAARWDAWDAAVAAASAASTPASAAARAAAYAVGIIAGTEAPDHGWLTTEFRRLCRLEGIYGEVAS